MVLQLPDICQHPLTMDALPVHDGKKADAAQCATIDATAPQSALRQLLEEKRDMLEKNLDDGDGDLVPNPDDIASG